MNKRAHRQITSQSNGGKKKSAGRGDEERAAVSAVRPIAQWLAVDVLLLAFNVHEDPRKASQWQRQAPKAF